MNRLTRKPREAISNRWSHVVLMSSHPWRTLCILFLVFSVSFLEVCLAENVVSMKQAKPPRENYLVSGGRKGHGHQGVATNGKQWFVFDTASIYRYETSDFTVDQTTLIRNMRPMNHPDFKGSGIDHLGAPECHDGNVYTFAKTYKDYKAGKCRYQVRLVWYDQKNLSYKGYVPIKLPPPGYGRHIEGNTQYNIGGGPVIRGEYFYSAIGQLKNGKKLPSRMIGKFKLVTGEFVEFISLGDATYSRPQGLFMDKQGNYYIPETGYGIKMFNASGMFERYIFRSGTFDIHEGLVYDPETRKLTFSLTRYKKEFGKRGDYILQVDLNEDLYRYVDRETGDDLNNGYTHAMAKKSIMRGKDSKNTSAHEATIPGMTLLISGYIRTSPVRTTIRSRYKGTSEYPVIWTGYPDVFYITGSDDFSETTRDCKWKESKTSGEYYLTSDNGKPRTSTAVRVLATATQENWNANGLDGVTKRNKGEAGSLKPGEWGWGDNDGLGFQTVYYRPAAGESIATLHMEAGQRADIVIMDEPYNICKRVKVFLANRESGTGIRTSGEGAVVEVSK